MEITVEFPEQGICVVRVSGELDLATAPAFDVVIRDVLATRPKQLVADLSSLTYINSSGMHVLLRADIRLSREGGRVVILGARPEVRVPLDLIGLPQRICCVNSMAEAQSTWTHGSHACRSNG
jgi:anti-anti-sigma factor